MPRHPGSTWIDENYDTLPANQWVAADKNGLVDHDSNFELLLKKVESKGIDSSEVVFMFVPEGINQ